jgi:hypothetical protein
MRTTPSVDPVRMTFIGFHSFSCEKQTQRMYCEGSIWHTRVLSVDAGQPVAVDRPQVEPSAGADGDVVRQVRLLP